jgi:hypothetical protein
MLTRLIPVLLATLLLVACPGPTPAETLHILGQVLHTLHPAMPLADVEVTSTGRRVFTDSAGRFEFADLTSASWVIASSVAGRGSQIAGGVTIGDLYSVVRASPGTQARLAGGEEVPTQPTADVQVTGTLGEPVALVQVVIGLGNRAFSAPTSTDDAGAFNVEIEVSWASGDPPPARILAAQLLAADSRLWRQDDVQLTAGVLNVVDLGDGQEVTQTTSLGVRAIDHGPTDCLRLERFAIYAVVGGVPIELKSVTTPSLCVTEPVQDGVVDVPLFDGVSFYVGGRARFEVNDEPVAYYSRWLGPLAHDIVTDVWSYAAPATLTAPAAGATGVSLTPEFSFTLTGSEDVAHLVLVDEENATVFGWPAWLFSLPSGASSVAVPDQGADFPRLFPSTSHRWTVTDFRGYAPNAVNVLRAADLAIGNPYDALDLIGVGDVAAVEPQRLLFTTID